jgi:hypothetical protein
LYKNIYCEISNIGVVAFPVTGASSTSVIVSPGDAKRNHAHGTVTYVNIDLLKPNFAQFSVRYLGSEVSPDHERRTVLFGAYFAYFTTATKKEKST